MSLKQLTGYTSNIAFCINIVLKTILRDPILYNSRIKPSRKVGDVKQRTHVYCINFALVVQYVATVINNEQHHPCVILKAQTKDILCEIKHITTCLFILDLQTIMSVFLFLLGVNIQK